MSESTSQKFETALFAALLFMLAASTCLADTESKNRSSPASTLYLNAIAHQKAAEYSTAIQEYKKAIDIDPNVADYYYALATCMQAMKQYKKASKTYQTAIRMKPRFANYYTAYATCLEAMNSFPDSIDAYRKASKLNPRDARNYYGLATCHQAMNRLEEASLMYKKAIKTDSKKAEYHFALGTCLERMNNTKKALEAYKSALSLDSAEPRYSAAVNNTLFSKALPLLNSGLSALYERDYHTAIAKFRRSLKIHSSKKAHYWLGIALMHIGRTQEAHREFEKSEVPLPREVLPDPAIPNNFS